MYFLTSTLWTQTWICQGNDVRGGGGTGREEEGENAVRYLLITNPKPRAFLVCRWNSRSKVAVHCCHTGADFTHGACKPVFLLMCLFIQPTHVALSRHWVVRGNLSTCYKLVTSIGSILAITYKNVSLGYL